MPSACSPASRPTNPSQSLPTLAGAGPRCASTQAYGTCCRPLATKGLGPSCGGGRSWCSTCREPAHPTMWTPCRTSTGCADELTADLSSGGRPCRRQRLITRPTASARVPLAHQIWGCGESGLAGSPEVVPRLVKAGATLGGRVEMKSEASSRDLARWVAIVLRDRVRTTRVCPRPTRSPALACRSAATRRPAVRARRLRARRGTRRARRRHACEAQPRTAASPRR